MRMILTTKRTEEQGKYIIMLAIKQKRKSVEPEDQSQVGCIRRTWNLGRCSSNSIRTRVPVTPAIEEADASVSSVSGEIRVKGEEMEIRWPWKKAVVTAWNVVEVQASRN